MNVLIVGAGAVGRWVADVLEDEVTYADVDERAAREAAAATDGRALEPGTDERFDAVCFAVPMSALSEAVEAHAPRAIEAVFDVTGSMTTPLAAMAEHAPNAERASFHPLFAPERAPGTVAVVGDSPGPVTDAVRANFEAAGNSLVETTAAEHDRAMATVQAKTHAAILAFALAADPVPEELRTPIYEDLAALADRVTDGTPQVYAEIQERFDGADDVAAAAARVADADPDEFERLYREAGERR